MNFYPKLYDFQKELFYCNYSAEFKNKIIFKTINTIKNNTENRRQLLFSLNDTLKNLYKECDFYYDFLIDNLIFKKIGSSVVGYNSIKIKQAQLFKEKNYINHPKIYNNIQKIYDNFFDSGYDYEIYKVYYDGFNVKSAFPSNYMKVVHKLKNKDIIEENINFINTLPVYIMSKQICENLFTNIFRYSKKDLNRINIKNKLKIDESETSNFNEKLLKYIDLSVFKESKFVDYFKSVVFENKIIELFNDFINSTITKKDLNSLTNNIFNTFTEEFVYLYRDLFTIDQDFESLLRSKLKEEAHTNTLQQDIYSIFTIAHNYSKDDIQFINSMLMTASLWLDYIINSRDLKNTSHFSNSEIRDIVKSVNIKSMEDFKQKLSNDFLQDLKNSKHIENVLISFYYQIISRFVSSKNFKEHILNLFIPSIAVTVRNKSKKLYLEIQELKNIDSIIEYIKFILLDYFINNNDLLNSYVNILGIDRFIFNIEHIDILKDEDIDFYKKEMNKFVISLSYIIFFDKYLEGFRL